MNIEDTLVRLTLRFQSTTVLSCIVLYIHVLYANNYLLV